MNRREHDHRYRGVTDEDADRSREDSAIASESTVRLAESEDLVAIMSVLDGSLLDVAAATVRERIESEKVFVAREEETIRGALVLAEPTNPEDGESETGAESEIEALAVRRRYRNRGIGSALVEHARRETEGALIAEFDGRVRSFYESLGFRVRPIDADDADGRFRGYDTGG